MNMKEALQVMSENPSGNFQWMEQLLSLLANIGVDGIHRDLTAPEVLKIVDRLDKPLKDIVMSVKVVFKDIPINKRNTPPPYIPDSTEYKSKLSNYVYYVFSGLLVIVGLASTILLNGEEFDADSKAKVLNFILEVIRTFMPA